MNAPVSVRLDADVRETLEAEAKSQGIGVATYLHGLASAAAREARRALIRAGSAAVARYIVENPDPTPGNGCTQRCFALAPFVTSGSISQMRATPSRITDQQLRRIRLPIAEAIGVA